MTFSEILYTLIIGPLELFFEVVFVIANKYVSNPAYAIIVLSLAVNFLALPLYRRADLLQAEEREKEQKLKPWIDHIKKTFHGDERFMMLQTYYRQNDYKPADALKGSISLLLQIPFFIAAYRFLSHLDALSGVSFGPISDMSSPDSLITIGSLTLNLLPILMTLINLVSATIYLKGFPIKSKVQMYGLALIFLALLYNSPSGLVFYWTLNNIFSLLKNIFYKLNNPGRILRVISFITGIILTWYFIAKQPSGNLFLDIIPLTVSIALLLPLLLHKIRPGRFIPAGSYETKALFYPSSIILAALIGLIVPSSVIKASPLEFLSLARYVSPVWYVVSAFILSAGLFFLWFSVFYYLASDSGKSVMAVIVAVIAVAAVINYMFFGNDYGNISSSLIYDIIPSITGKAALLNLALLLPAAFGIVCLSRKKPALLKNMLIITSVALFIMAGINTGSIVRTLDKSSSNVRLAAESTPEITLSKNGQNVVIIMMDRMIGHFIPYIFHERPDLKNNFEGFTYYSNVVSLGAYTNFAAPALYGGYDYTPDELNERDEFSLQQKHEEALRLMPSLFSAEGYNVKILDPPYAGYSWIPDISIFDDIDNTNVYVTTGKYSLGEFDYTPEEETQVSLRKRNFFCYGIMKCAPVAFHLNLYGNGAYNSSGASTDFYYFENYSISRGYDNSFMNSYAELCHLSDITSISDSGENTLTIMANNLTHQPVILQEPEYVPSRSVDNSPFEDTDKHKYDDSGNEMILDNPYQISHYHVNMAAFLKLAEYFEMMKEEGVYDNTRIIIVSDHGRDIGDNIMPYVAYTTDDGEEASIDTCWFDCALMIKDFDSTGFSEYSDFTTNADTLSLAIEDLIVSGKNPFTGNDIIKIDEYNKDLAIIYPKGESDYSVEINNGNVFIPAYWLSVDRDIYDADKWRYLGYH